MISKRQMIMSLLIAEIDSQIAAKAKLDLHTFQVKRGYWDNDLLFEVLQSYEDAGWQTEILDGFINFGWDLTK